MNNTIDVNALLTQMANNLRQAFAKRNMDDVHIIGIHTGGLWVAEKLHAQLGIKNPLGALNISFYRDDFTRSGLHPQVKPSNLPFTVEGKNILLVDDVLFTGRTIRAALNEIFDYGRPKQIMLAVLVDRGGRELPMQADVVGQSIELSPEQQVKLAGPEPLILNIESES